MPSGTEKTMGSGGMNFQNQGYVYLKFIQQQ